MKSSPPWSRTRCTQPERRTCLPASALLECAARRGPVSMPGIRKGALYLGTMPGCSVLCAGILAAFDLAASGSFLPEMADFARRVQRFFPQIASSWIKAGPPERFSSCERRSGIKETHLVGPLVRERVKTWRNPAHGPRYLSRTRGPSMRRPTT